MILIKKHVSRLSGNSIPLGLVLNRISFYFSKVSQSMNKQLLGKALLAYYTISYISQFEKSQLPYKNGKSIRQMLLDKWHFYRFMTKQIEAHQRQNFITMDDSLLQQLNPSVYRQIMSIFEIEDGHLFNYIAFNQNRSKEATNSLNCIVIHPVSLTSQYYNAIVRKHVSILSGEKGSGKSFSFLSFDYFSSFIIKSRLQYKNSHQQILKKYLPLKQLQGIPKIIYINMRDQLKFEAYFLQIYLQTAQILTQQDRNYWNLKNPAFITRKQMVHLLATLRITSINKNIKTMLIIDEANRIFKLFEKLEKLIKSQSDQRGRVYSQETKIKVSKFLPQKWRQTTTFKSLVFYSDLISLMSMETPTAMNGTLFNSSQDFQVKDIETRFCMLVDQMPLINLLGEKLKIRSKSQNIHYSEFLSNNEGQLELYSCFWFEILAFVQFNKICDTINAEETNELSEEQFVRVEELMSQYRKAFEQAFQIDETHRKQFFGKQQHILEVKIWRNEVRHLHIREYLRNLGEKFKMSDRWCQMRPQYDLFSKLCKDPTEEQLKSFKINVIKLKAQIENYRKLSIIDSIKTYISKGLDRQSSRKRFKYLQQLENQVSLSKSSAFGLYYQYSCNKIPKQQKGEFISGLGFGYYDSKTNRLLFSSQRQYLLDIFKQLKSTKEFVHCGMSHYLYLTNNRMHSNLHPYTFYGQMLNSFLFFVVNSYSQKYSLQLTKSNVKNREKQTITFVVSQSRSFQGFTQIVSEGEYLAYLQKKKKYPQYSLLQTPKSQENFNFANPKPQFYSQKSETYYPISKKLIKQQFMNLIQLARENSENSNYILGYPVIYKKDFPSLLKGNDEARPFLSLNNQIRFDHVLFRMKEDLEIVFIDWTLGRITSKMQPKQKTVITNANIKECMKKHYEFIIKIKEILSYDGEVKCTFLIAAPQYYVDNYAMSYEKNGSWQISLGVSSFRPNISVTTDDELIKEMKQIFTQIFKKSKMIELENKNGNK